MCASSALRSSALDGMQPTLRQTPPQYFFSTMAALAELGGADRGDVPTGAGTEHDDVIVICHAVRVFCRAARGGTGPVRSARAGSRLQHRVRERREALAELGHPPAHGLLHLRGRLHRGASAPEGDVNGDGAAALRTLVEQARSAQM